MRSLALILLLCFAVTGHAQIAVVVHRDSPIDSLSEEEVASIFLGKTNRLPNGERALPMEINDVELRRRFYQSISGKSLNQLNSYWATLIFTGKGKPPKVLKDAEDIATQFPADRGAITYLPSDQVTETMKVVYDAP